MGALGAPSVDIGIDRGLRGGIERRRASHPGAEAGRATQGKTGSSAQDVVYRETQRRRTHSRVTTTNVSLRSHTFVSLLPHDLLSSCRGSILGVLDSIALHQAPSFEHPIPPLPHLATQGASGRGENEG